MIFNGRRRSAISIGSQSASCPRHMETLKTLSGTVCDNRRHIIVPLKSRVSNCPMRTETFAANSETNILRTCVITWSVIANKLWKHLCDVCDSSIADSLRPLQTIRKPGFIQCRCYTFHVRLTKNTQTRFSSNPPPEIFLLPPHR